MRPTEGRVSAMRNACTKTKAAVNVANKLAHWLWALDQRSVAFDARHVSHKSRVERQSI